MSRRWKDYYQYQAMEEGTWLIKDLYGDCCYLLEGREGALLVDSGIGLPGFKELIRQLTRKPVRVLLTHGHLDHIGGCGYWQEVWIHEKEIPTFHLHQSAGYRKIIHGLTEEVGIKMDEEALRGCINIKIPSEICFIKEGIREQQIDLGGRRLKIIETPGHTKGSVCLWESDREVLYSGDTICEKRVMLSFPESCGAGCYYKSLQRLTEIRDGIHKIYAGHNQVPLSPLWIEYFRDCAYALAERQSIGWIEDTNSVFGKCQIFKVGPAELTCNIERE